MTIIIKKSQIKSEILYFNILFTNMIGDQDNQKRHGNKEDLLVVKIRHPY